MVDLKHLRYADLLLLLEVLRVAIVQSVLLDYELFDLGVLG